MGQKNRASIHRDKLKESEETSGNPHTLIIFIRFSGRRKRDLDNCVSSILDELVTTKKIEEDDIQTVDCVLSFGIPVEKGKEGFDVIIL